MKSPIVLLSLPDSPLAADLARQLAAAGTEVLNLDLDATLDGEPVTVNGDEVVWQNCPLHEAGAIWLESPVFPWPQSLPPPCEIPDEENLRRWHTYQRESRALASSALAVAADHVPLMNRPESSHLAAAPTAALDILAAAGVAIQPWSIGATPRAGDLARDATGRDRWHPAGPPPDSAPRLVHQAFDGPVWEMLVVGGQVAGTLQWADGPTWIAAQSPPSAVAAHADLEDLAVRAAASLDLEMLQVSCVETNSGPQLLVAEATPRLAAWNQMLDGRVAVALARRLTTLASAPGGKTT